MALRKTLRKGFPHWGSLKLKAARESFTIKMDQHYDYYFTSDDPDELFEQTQGFFDEVQEMTTALSGNQADAYEEFFTSAFTELIFGSNLIENAGLGHEITIRICKAIFAGEIDVANIELREDEYQQALEELKSRNLEPSHSAILRSRAEIVQHALALKHITTHMVVLNEPLSEELILKTHNILTRGIDGPGGDKSETYSGIYRKGSVVAGFSSFAAPILVPSVMKALVSDFNDDIKKAEEIGELDPYSLAAKYCHKFVNIHPFLDGNGRICRLILNAVLLKYAGIVVALGEKEDDRKE
jgi:fido (protein-threonine AMPylation protein)